MACTPMTPPSGRPGEERRTARGNTSRRRRDHGRAARRRVERMPTIDAPTARKTLGWAMFIAAYVSLWIVVLASGS